MPKLSLLSITLSSLIFFSACEKSDLKESENEGTRLKQKVAKWNDSLIYTNYLYDSEQRLIALLDSNNNQMLWSKLLHYNANNQIDTVKGASGWKTLNDPSNYLSFRYDANNRIIKKVTLPFVSDALSIKHAYGYDANNRLVADTAFRKWPNDIYGIIYYTYDANDNLVRIKEEGGPTLGWPQNNPQMSYDNKPNPYAEKGLLLYILTHNIDYLSKNNKIKTDYQTSFAEFTYEYQSNGLPKKVSEFWNEDPAQEGVEFFYE